MQTSTMAQMARVYPFLPSTGGKRVAPELDWRNVLARSAHAPTSLRVAAFVIDGAAWLTPSLFSSAIIFMTLLPRWLNDHGPEQAQLYTAGSVAAAITGIFVFLFAIVPIALQGTIGMRLCGISVVSEAYERARWTQHLTRFFFEFPGMFLLGAGYVAALLNDGRQCWHDYFSHTYVIRSTDQIRLRQNFLKQLATVHVLDPNRARPPIPERRVA